MFEHYGHNSCKPRRVLPTDIEIIFEIDNLFLIILCTDALFYEYFSVLQPTGF